MNFPNIRAALFDLDGVVVLTDRYHYRAWKVLADSRGWAFDEAVNEGCKGVPRMESLEVILRHNGLTLAESEKESLASEKNTVYVASLEFISHDDLIPGVLPFLEGLQEGGVPMALCSSSRNAKLVIERLGIAPLFSTVVTGADITHPKPHPEIFLQGAAGLGVPPEQAVVFEDASSGVEAARAAGCRCVGLGEPDLLPGADEWIRDFLDPRTSGLISCLRSSQRS
jgi:beta-phosphoglucomutase